MTSDTFLDTIRQAEDHLTQRYRDLLVVNKELDRTLVSFQANKTETGHRWFKYKEGFSASLMRYLFERVNLTHGHLLEPFAGSGTALFVASALGMDATGIELLPSSAESIEVRRSLLAADRSALAIRVRAFCAARSWEHEGEYEPFNHIKITAGAFPPETERQLGRFLHDAAQGNDLVLTRLLRVAAMSILEAISYTRKDGQYLRWDGRSGRQLGKIPFDKGYIADFTAAIVPKLTEIAADLCDEQREPQSLFDEFVPDVKPGSVHLLRGSCLDILSTLSAQTYDGIVTSPPYCNRYDYTRTYALELAMLGVNETQIRQLRQAMLSCTVENREKIDLADKIDKELFCSAQEAFEQQETLQLILSYLESCRDAGTINNSGIPRMVRNYFWEMALVIFECTRVLRPGAPFVMVNDNVRYMGAHIPVDLILSDFAQAAGLAVETIWVLPRGKGNSSQQMGTHGREEVRKCVYIWRKP